MPRDPTRTTMCTPHFTSPYHENTNRVAQARSDPAAAARAAAAHLRRRVGFCGGACASRREPGRSHRARHSRGGARRCTSDHSAHQKLSAPHSIPGSRPVDGPTNTRTQARARTGQIGAELLDHVNRSASLTEGPVRRRARAPTFAVFYAACDGSASESTGSCGLSGG